MSRVLDDLNPEQRQAVTHVEGPLCVVAGAGSGKTRVITRRITHLIECGARPDSILGVTFSNKAARELRERVRWLGAPDGAWISTFHAFCVQVLRRDAPAIGRRVDFTIYDSDDAVSVMKRACEQLGIDTEAVAPSSILEYLSELRNSRPDHAPEPPGGSAQSRRDDVERAIQAYHEALVAANALDFDELLLETLHLFTAAPDALAAWRARIEHVLVDEFQDTNWPQYQIVRLLAEESRNLCVTGDPDQSIYTWRGADPRNFDDFRRDFPEAQTVVLSQNYRSTNHILRCASAVMDPIRDRIPKRLWSELGDGEPVYVVNFGSDREEADTVVEEIAKWEGEGFSRDAIAVMFRVNALTLPVERALAARGIRYRVLGGPAFFGRQEVKDLVAYLRILANPLDTQAFTRVMNVPPRGLGDKTRALVFDAARSAGIAPFDLVRRREWPAAVGKRGHAALAAFADLLDELAELPTAPVRRLLDRIVDRIGYTEWWRGRSAAASATDPLRNITQLVAFAGECDQKLDCDLRGFLEQTALLGDTDQGEDTNRVTLLTIHAAKGLEFEAVIVVGVEDDLIPHASALYGAGGFDEERRLLHVAITRARRRLVLTCTRSRFRFGKEQLSRPSRFLAELPREDVEWVGAGREPGSGGRSTELELEMEADPDDPLLNLRPGSRVRDPDRGTGEVVTIRNRALGLDAVVVVRFAGGDTARILLRYAKLTVLEADDW